MQLGVALPTSGPLAGTEGIRRVAVEAERIGYTTLWTYERLLRPMAELPEAGDPPQRISEFYRLTFEPLQTLSYVAGLTSSIGLGTAAIIAPLHVPVVLARQFATLDQLSGGRVIAGLAQGWIPQEFEAANVSMSRRGAAIDEVAAAMRACWGPDPVEYHGDLYRIAPSEVNPKPAQAHIPILYAPGSEAAVRRAARRADGVFLGGTEAEIRSDVRLFRNTALAAGRDPTGLRVIVQALVPITRRPMRHDRPFLGGSPEQIAEDLQITRELAVSDVYFRDETPEDLGGHIDLIARLYAAARI